MDYKEQTNLLIQVAADLQAEIESLSKQVANYKHRLKVLERSIVLSKVKGKKAK